MIDSEARLLWATHEQTSKQEHAVVLDAARDLNIAVKLCTHRDLFETVGNDRYDVVGIELPNDARTGLQQIRDLHQRSPRLTIIAALHDSSVATLRAALEAGAVDIVSLPLSQAEISKALLKFRQVRVREAAGRGTAGEVITVYGARGGLGATTLAVNLAVRLTQVTTGNVALIDLDLQRGDVATFLKLMPHESIAALASAPGEIDEIFLHGMLTRHSSGVSVLPAPQEIVEADAVGHDEVKLALGLVRSQFRYTVVDTPRVISGPTIPAFEHADRILLVTDLSIPSVRAARRFLDLMNHLHVPAENIGLIVTEIVSGPVELKDAIRSLGKEPLFTIPRDEAAASRAMNSGDPLNGRPGGLSLAVSELAARIARVEPAKRRGNFLRRMFTKEATAS